MTDEGVPPQGSAHANKMRAAFKEFDKDVSPYDERTLARR